MIEAAVRLILVILLVAAVPAAAIAVGRQTDHLAWHWVQTQRSSHHRVTAVLLRDAPAIGNPDPYAPVQGALVPARWQPAGQPPRTGEVFAVASARKGSTVRIWIDSAGAVTGPPLSQREVAGDICLAVVATCLVSWLVLLAAWRLGRYALDRRRLNAWEDEWRSSGPLWSGRRG